MRDYWRNKLQIRREVEVIENLMTVLSSLKIIQDCHVNNLGIVGVRINDIDYGSMPRSKLLHRD